VLRTRSPAKPSIDRASPTFSPALDQEKLNAALMLVKGGMSPTLAVNRLSGNSKPT